MIKTNWASKAEEMAMHYGTTTARGSALLTVSALCESADKGEVGYTRTDDRVGITGHIPSCIERGLEFSRDGMTSRLLGLAAVYADHCSALVTHDLHSFTIKNIGALVSAIRISN